MKNKMIGKNPSGIFCLRSLETDGKGNKRIIFNFIPFTLKFVKGKRDVFA